MSEPDSFRPVAAKGALKVPVVVSPPFSALEPRAAGTSVRRAEPLAGTPPSAPASLSPVAGTVGPAVTTTLTSGRETPAITVNPIADVDPWGDPSPDGPARLRDLLRDAKPEDLSRYTDLLRTAGVWADRWTSPDLLGQLHQCLKRPVDTILCNAMDFDATLRLQQATVLAYPLEVLTAVAMLAALTRADRSSIAVDAAWGHAATKAVKRVSLPDVAVQVTALRNRYPQPSPTLLLHALTRRPLRPGRLPTEAGALVLDAVAAAAVGRCLLYDEPAVRALVGIADVRDANAPAGTTSHLLSVPAGMAVADVLREAGISGGEFEARASSPLRELRISPNSVISVGGEAALYLVAPQPQINPAPCIRCGWCNTGCPVNIHPADILQAAQTHDRLAAERHGIDSCIDCGVCSYVCPSNLPLLAGIRSLRTETV